MRQEFEFNALDDINDATKTKNTTKTKNNDELWTRVIKLFGENQQVPGTHLVAQDLQYELDYW